jgi:hypothetical protein
VAIRQTFVESVRLNASGAGEVSITARGDFDVQHTNVIVAPLPSVLVPTAALTLNGSPFEGSQTGDFDSSDTRHLMLAGDILTCTWTGGDAGKTATFTVRGVEYAAGTGMKATSGQGR